MQKVSASLTRFMQRYLPEPLTIALLLTIIAFVLAMTISGSGFIETTMYWGDGFWDLLEFTMQMSVILLTGYVLAKTKPVDRSLDKVVSFIKTPSMAIVAATFIAGVATLINWGFGLIIGAIVAKKIAMEVKGVHYPLIIAAAYSGFALYGSGLSGSVPIIISTPGHFLEDEMGTISITETILSTPMIITSLVLLLTLPFVNMFLHPKNEEEVMEVDKFIGKEKNEVVEKNVVLNDITLADRLNDSKILALSIGIVGMVYTVLYFMQGNSLNINLVNLFMLFFGLIMAGTITYYFKLVLEGVYSIAGMIIQFPFYAGIIGILGGSGLGASIAYFFTTFSTTETLPFWALISGFFTNMLVPSGGGQWAIQGPVMMEAAKGIGASFSKTAMGVQLGDAWNNMIQPFLLLAVLGISGLKLKDLMGYLVIMMVWIGIVFGVAVLIWGYIG